MNKLMSVVRGMIRESRRVGQNGLARNRSKARESFSLAFQELRSAVQSMPHGFPQGSERSNRGPVVFLRMEAA